MKTSILKAFFLISTLFIAMSVSAADNGNQPYTIDLFSCGDGSLRAFTAIDGTIGDEIAAGSQIMSSECAEGIILMVEADQYFMLSALYVNGEEVTEDVVDGIYHCTEIDGDMQVSAMFDVELAHLVSIVSDYNEAGIEVYNIQGMRVNSENLTPGYYIMRRGTQTAKIYVK